MIEYEEDFETMAVFCDDEDCKGEEFLEGTWKECIYELKQLGWKILHKEGQFIHSCPRHRVDFID